ncbi:MAG: SH3 domain-containing protein [Caldilineaceae bacterium]|nr:SH3 domain-containing protein [Caldilineaceae bacterium]
MFRLSITNSRTSAGLLAAALAALVVLAGCQVVLRPVQDPGSQPVSGRSQVVEIAPGLPLYTLIISANPAAPQTGGGRYLVGNIQVSSGATGATTQTIGVEMEDPTQAEQWAQRDLQVADVNFDGYQDIGYYEVGGAKWARYFWWLFDPNSGLFYTNALTRAISELRPNTFEVDARNGTIRIEQIAGTCPNRYTYRVVGDQLVEVAREETVPGQSGCVPAGATGVPATPTSTAVIPTPRPPTPTPLPPIDVVPTAVQYVLAKTNVNIRSGPALGYAVIGRVFAGQIAAVTGVTRDGGWWRVVCPDGSIGNCFVSADPSLTQPTAPPSTPPPAQDTGAAVVESLQVQILESFPVQVRAVVRGQLPDACTVINAAYSVREGSTFRIRMTTTRTGEFCAQVLTPFEEVVSLDVVGLPAGIYDVRVNNLRETFTLAVDNRPPVENTNAAVIESLQVRILESFPVQVDAIVRGYLPDACTGINSARSEREGSTFRVSLITQRAGQVCAQVLVPFEQWVPLEVAGLPAGIYEVRAGNLREVFTLATNNVPPPIVTEVPVVGTDVQYLYAQTDVPIYGGPAGHAPVVGQIFGGMMAAVTGVTPDGGWWRIMCPDDTVGNCFVRNDPALVTPANTP